MKSNKIIRTTTNRGEFNRAYKFHLEQKGKISCSYCKYHHGENSDHNYYGGYPKINGHLKITHPNWKLVSKHPKQWMYKPINIITKRINRSIGSSNEYIEIRF